MTKDILSRLWDMANDAYTLEQAHKAEVAIGKAFANEQIDFDDYDDLMITVSMQIREHYRDSRSY